MELANRMIPWRTGEEMSKSARRRVMKALNSIGVADDGGGRQGMMPREWKTRSRFRLLANKVRYSIDFGLGGPQIKMGPNYSKRQNQTDALRFVLHKRGIYLARFSISRRKDN